MSSHAGVEAGSTGDCPGSTEQDPADSQLDKMLPSLQRCSTSTEIEEVIQRQYSRRRSGRTPDPCPANPRNDTGVRFNGEFVKTASSILTGRSSTAYSRGVKDEYSVPTPLTGRYGDADSSDDGGDDSGDDSDGEEDPNAYSNKIAVPWIAAYATKMNKSGDEMKDLPEHVFFVTRCESPWYMGIVEALAKVRGRNFRYLFQKSSAKNALRWDYDRRKCDISPGDPLYKMVTEPLLHKMRKLSMLRVVRRADGESEFEEGEKRVVGVCAALESKPPKQSKGSEGLQGMHADMSRFHYWQEEFGFSTITAGTKAAFLDIYPGSFNAWKGQKVAEDLTKRKPVRIKLRPGETIVLNGLARQRGVGYARFNLRFFVSLIVKQACDAADKDEKGYTTCKLEKHSEPERPAFAVGSWSSRTVKK
ncbi:unnamed protein product [Ectocarpus sp. 13 AM-2016]